MNEIKVFEHVEFGQVRTMVVNGEPWFVGKDVATALGYKNANDALSKHVSDCDKDGIAICDTIGRRQKTPFINKSGMYALIFGSKLEGAKRFKSWAMREVLPSIRKYGAYITPTTIEEIIANPDSGIKLLQALKDEQNKVKEMKATIDDLKVYADYATKILESKGTVNITQVAKDYGMSAREINLLLHKLKIQYKCGGQWVLYAPYQDKGYTESETYESPYGYEYQTMHTKWTQRGRFFLYEVLKGIDIIPMCER